MVEKRSLTKKILKWTAGIFLFIVVLIGAAAIYINAKWKPVLTQKIKEGVYNASAHLYKIDFKDIRLNLIAGSVTVDSVLLLPDTTTFDSLKKVNKAPTHLFQFKLASLNLSGVGIYDAYFKKTVDVKSIVLDKPSINIIFHKVKRQVDTANVEKTLYEQISKTLKSIQVHRIRIIDADADYINGFNGIKLNSVKHLNVNVDDFLLDSLSQHDKSRFYYAKDASFELAGYRSISKDKMYTMKVDTIVGSATGQTLRIKGLKMIPMYPDLKFSRINKVQKDRYDLSFSSINFRGVDFLTLNSEGALHTKSVNIGPSKVAIFLNRELPPAKINKGDNYPHMALKRLPLPTIIDTLKLSKIDIAYTEFDPITQKRGTLFISQLTGAISNVTNDSLQLLKNNHAIASVSTFIQNKIKTSVTLNFNLTAANAAFTYKGTIGTFDMKLLNPLSRSLGLVEIETGTVQKATFDMKGTRTGASGLVHFYYNNLKVKLLKEGEDGAPMKKKGLLSFLANTLIVKDSNPTKSDPARTATVTFQRAPGASFFNLMWKSIFTGIREIVGLGIVPMKSPKQIQEKISDKKEERQERRQKRIEKRERRKDARKTN